ncbi:MAG TPA: radical SAM protein [Candidatus Wallbacteria bacterium]|nr:radical SAM protein [Candidatus Wallbacteria bacterium]
MKKTKDKSSGFIFVDLIYHPVLALGPGERTGLWTRGCTIRCPGCSADHAWEFLEEYKMKTEEAVGEILKYAKAGCRALTISGGEPFDQPEALNALLEAVRRGGVNDIFIYSGYPYETLKKKYGGILDKTDVLIDSPFQAGTPSKELWRGSGNQNMIILTGNKILKEKYEAFAADNSGGRKLQVITHKDKVYIIGIGDQDDVAAIRSGFGSI